MKPTNTFCGQNSELVDVKADGTFKLPHCFKGLRHIILAVMFEIFYVIQDLK